MPSDVGDIVAIRKFERDDGEVVLFLHKPRPDPDPRFDADPTDPPWRCGYTIQFPDDVKAFRGAVGVDGMQAMLLALAAAQADLKYKGRGERRPPIRYLGEDDLGLSITQLD